MTLNDTMTKLAESFRNRFGGNYSLSLDDMIVLNKIDTFNYLHDTIPPLETTRDNSIYPSGNELSFSDLDLQVANTSAPILQLYPKPDKFIQVQAGDTIYQSILVKTDATDFSFSFSFWESKYGHRGANTHIVKIDDTTYRVSGMNQAITDNNIELLDLINIRIIDATYFKLSQPFATKLTQRDVGNFITSVSTNQGTAQFSKEYSWGAFGARDMWTSLYLNDSLVYLPVGDYTLSADLDLTNISYSVGMRLENVTGNLSSTVNTKMTAGDWINPGQKGHSSISIKIAQAGIFRFGFSGLNDNNTDKWSSFGWSNYMLNKGTKELPYTPYP